MLPLAKRRLHLCRQNLTSLTDANSFWIDGYLKEPGVASLNVGDPAEVKLMSWHCHVSGGMGTAVG